MTENEAIKNVTAYVYMECENMPMQVVKALDVMKNCTKEIQQYRAIGTVEEFKALKEKEERFDRNIKMFNEIGLEIRNKAIDDVFDFLKTQRGEKYKRVNFDDLEIRKYKEQLKAGGNND